MKCPKCGATNNKNNKECKKCNASLHEEVKKEVKVEDITPVKEKKEEKTEKIVEEPIVPIHKKKKKNVFQRIWIAIKLLIMLSVVAVIALFVYVFFFYDYTSYFKDNMNRYYETENTQYIDSIKLIFKVYKFDDKKISKIQENGYELVQSWISDVKEKEYSLEDEYKDDLGRLEDVLEALYNETNVDGHTAISKKSYQSLIYEVRELKKATEVEEEPEEQPVSKPTSNYDVSMMHEVNVAGAIKLFGQKGTYVLYIGRADCGACVNYLPSLQDAQAKFGYTTQYLDLNKIDFSSSDYDKLKEKLDIDYTMTVSGEEKTETFGTWMGYTPMTIIIKDGKMVDGKIGSIAYESLIALLKENGIE